MASKINLLDPSASKQFIDNLKKVIQDGNLKVVKKAFKEIGDEYLNKVKTIWPRTGRLGPAMADGFTYRLRQSNVKESVELIIYNETHGSLVHLLETGTATITPRRYLRDIWDRNENNYLQKTILFIDNYLKKGEI